MLLETIRVTANGLAHNLMLNKLQENELLNLCYLNQIHMLKLNFRRH